MYGRSARIGAVLAVLTGIAGSSVAVGATPTRPRAALSYVSVAGGGQLLLPTGSTARRTGGTDAYRGPAETAASPSTEPGPLAGDEAAVFPPAAPPDPGTVTTVAGGSCEGYPALAATVTPARIALSPDGRLLWSDNAMFAAPRQAAGSVTVRRVDKQGRVRTLGSLLEPAEGRAFRQDRWRSSWQSAVVADGPDAALVTAGRSSPWRGAPPLRDVPSGSVVLRLTNDGRRDVIAGGLAEIDGESRSRAPEPATATMVHDAQGLAVDARGNVFYADVNPPYDTRIRYVNRRSAPVTFFAGTNDEVTVGRGQVATIIVFPPDPTLLDTTLAMGARPVQRFAARERLGAVPRLELRGSVLYALDVRWNGQLPIRSQPAVIKAFNLSSRGTVVNGVPIPPYEVRVVAGDEGRTSGYSGDGGPATLAQFGFGDAGLTGDFAVAHDGTLYVADTMNHRIRAVSPLGIVTTVAGTGLQGLGGERVAAVLTPIRYPLGITIDAAGRVLFAETGNGRVRRIDADGTILTILGRGPSPCGDGHLATGRTIFGGAYFGRPGDIAVDSRGRTYVTDLAFKTIRRIEAGGRVGLVLGAPARCGPAITVGGNYPPEYQDSGQSCPLTGPQSADGPLSTLRFARPERVIVDSYDNLVVSDIDRVRYVNLLSRPLSVLGLDVPAGSVVTLRSFPNRNVTVSPPGTPGGPLPIGGAQPPELTVGIGDLALDNAGNLYIADPLMHQVYRLTPCRQFEVVAGNGLAPAYGGQGDGGPATAAAVRPQSMALDRARGLLFIADYAFGSGGTLVRAVNLGNSPQRVFGLDVPPGLIERVAGSTDCLGQVCSYGDGGPARSAALAIGVALAWDGSRLYLAEEGTNRVRVLEPTGRISGVAGPWPDSRSTSGHGGFGDRPPAGYLGDGGPALEAWFSWTSRHDGTNPDVDGGFVSAEVDRAGGLLLTDLSGRVRRISQIASAPRRLGAALPVVADAGRGFTDTLVLPTDVAEDGGGPRRPRIALPRSAAYVAAAAGAGRGCNVWRIVRNADGRGGDAAEQATRPSGPLGGTDCDVSAAGPDRLAVATPVRPRDGAVANQELAILTAGSDDSARTWLARPDTGAQDRAGGLDLGGVATAWTGREYVLAYRTAQGTARIATSADGSSYVPVAELPVDPVLIGTMASRGGRLAIAMVVSRPAGDVVVVAESRDSRTWTIQELAPAVGPVSPPAAAIDASGVVFVAWSDASQLRLWRRTAAANWRAVPVRVAASVAAAPTLATDGGGSLAIGFVGTRLPRANSTSNPYARWYAFVAVTHASHSLAPSFTTKVASTTDIAYGSLCYDRDCPPEQLGSALQALPFQCGVGAGCPASSAVLGSARVVSPVSVSIAPEGELELAFAIDAGSASRPSGGRAIGHARACVSLGLTVRRGRLPCRASKGRAPTQADAASAPALPSLALPSVGACSPPPPPFLAPAAPPARAGQAAPQDPPAPPGSFAQPAPRPALPPVAPEVPGYPGFPAGNAPANNPQTNNVQQYQPDAANQVNPQAGLAVREDAQPEGAVQLATSRPGDTDPVVLLSLASLLSGMAYALFLTRSRSHSSAAYIRTAQTVRRRWPR